MWLEIEVISDIYDVPSVALEVESGHVGSLNKLGHVILVMFQVYDPIALHIIKPIDQRGKANGKEKK